MLRDDELRQRLAAFGITPESLAPDGFGRLVRMPYLFVFGRADSTVSVMGANIYPVDVEGGIYADPSLAAHVRSFRLSLLEERPGETRPLVSIELERDEPTDELTSQLASTIEAHLLATNTDYREAAGRVPGADGAGRAAVRRRYRAVRGLRRAHQAPLRRLIRRDTPTCRGKRWITAG